MKKKNLLFVSIFIFLALFWVSHAAAFSFEYKGSWSGKSGKKAELKSLIGLLGLVDNSVRISDKEDIPDPGADGYSDFWDLEFNLDAEYIILKTGNLAGYTDNNHFAFIYLPESDTPSYGDLIKAMYNFLNSEFDFDDSHDLDWFKGKASHFTIFTINESPSVPIPAAVILLGSGMIGLAGIRMGLRRKK